MGTFESKSVSELEGWKWKDEIPTRETHGGIETRFYELHKKPLSELSFDDIRFLIGQNSGLKYLVPIALKQLKEDIFFEAEYYSGDLFMSLIQISEPKNYWGNHPKEKQELIELYQSQKKRLGELGLPEEVIEKIKLAYKEFLNK